MLPKWHVLYSFVFVIILIDFFNFPLLGALVVFLAAIFIDVDHILIYFLETKSLDLGNFYSWSMKKREWYKSLSSKERERLRQPHFILHGIEFILFLIPLVFLHDFFLWVLVGVLFHLMLDFIHLFYESSTHYSIRTSQIWLWQRNKNKKRVVFL
jgi:hypothetical protein